jgi:protein-S-isoprenylcysteine O-methyltransferase Ste14
MVFLFMGMIAGFSAASCAPAAIHAHRAAIFWTGIALMIGGIVLRQTAIRTLGKYFTFTVRVRQEQPVVDFGPYRWIRHPSYTGALLTMAGVGLALTNWASLVLILLAGAVGYTYRISVEERALSETLGEPYAAYMRRTWRLIPFIF